MFFLGSVDPVLATVAFSDPRVDPGSVELVRRTNSGFVSVTALRDDGVQGDEVAGDGVYSGSFDPTGWVSPGSAVALRASATLPSEARSVVTMTRQLVLAPSPSSGLYEQFAQHAEQVAARLNATVSTTNPGAAYAGELSTLINEFSNDPLVEAVELWPHALGMTVKYAGGPSESFYYTEPDLRGAATPLSRTRQLSSVGYRSSLGGSRCEAVPSNEVAVFSFYRHQFLSSDEGAVVHNAALAEQCLNSTYYDYFGAGTGSLDELRALGG